MRTLEVSWGIIWRMAALGLVLGLVLGALYGLLVAFVVGLLYGALIGAIAGLVLGLADGIAMALFTNLAFYPVTDGRFYRGAMMATCVVVAACLAIWIYGGGNDNLLLVYLNAVTQFMQPFRTIELSNFILPLIPQAIAVAASIFASSKVAGWVIFESLTELRTGRESRLQTLSDRE